MADPVRLLIHGASGRMGQTLLRPHKVKHPCTSCGLIRHDPDAVHCKACGEVLCIPDEGAH